jgi:hypothetical protein
MALALVRLGINSQIASSTGMGTFRLRARFVTLLFFVIILRNIA